MIIEDTTTYADRGLVRRYSDRNVYIANPDGVMYSEAVDLASRSIQYVETDVPADPEKPITPADPEKPITPAAKQDPDAERIAELEAELKRLKGGRA